MPYGQSHLAFARQTFQRLDPQVQGSCVWVPDLPVYLRQKIILGWQLPQVTLYLTGSGQVTVAFPASMEQPAEYVMTLPDPPED